jgi:TonB family protein
MLYIALENTIKNEQLNINTTNQKNTTKNNGLVKVKYVKIKQPVKKEPVKKTPEVKEPKKASKPIIEKEKKQIKNSVPLIKLPVVKKEKLDLKKFFTIQEEEKKELEAQKKKEKKVQEELDEIRKLPEETQNYIKLYGEQFFEFSENQRKYLKQNLNKIGEITQRYLTYPRISVRTKQEGLNVIEFYLHPNGDITQVKITDSSYYTALDDNTLETIRLAYQDYPKPIEKVKIKIYVKYILY